MKIIDVRSKEEFEEGHLENAVNFDLKKIMSGNFPDLPKDSEILVYCASGARSGVAKKILEFAGFANVTNGGSFEVLKAKGL